MLEFILSKTILIVFSLAVLIASGSIISTFYSEQEGDEADAAFWSIARIIAEVDGAGSEFVIRLDMSGYLQPESVLLIGNGSMMLHQSDLSLAASLPYSVRLKAIDELGSGMTLLEVRHDDVLVLERSWFDGSPQILIYIEKVDATFSTALTNRSASSTVL